MGDATQAMPRERERAGPTLAIAQREEREREGADHIADTERRGGDGNDVVKVMAIFCLRLCLLLSEGLLHLSRPSLRRLGKTLANFPPGKREDQVMTLL